MFDQCTHTPTQVYKSDTKVHSRLSRAFAGSIDRTVGSPRERASERDRIMGPATVKLNDQGYYIPTSLDMGFGDALVYETHQCESEVMYRRLFHSCLCAVVLLVA